MFHDKLTIVSINGNSSGEKAIPAILTSLEQLQGSDSILFSPIKPKNLPSNIRWQEILPLNYDQYSLFIYFSLHHYLTREFCLIVQDDGWCINGSNFTEDYYLYDYIGAPCHAAFVGNNLITNYQWVSQGDFSRVIQNGGFSLRSKRLLQAPTRFGGLYLPHNEAVFRNEDVQFTGIFKERLESLGFKFAPIEIAMNFSVEYLGPIIHDNLDFSTLVGIHGQSRKLISNKCISILSDRAETAKIFREMELLNFLRNGRGYDIHFIDQHSAVNESF